MDYEQITLLRDQLDNIDDILREKQTKLRTLDAVTDPPAPEQTAQREALVTEIEGYAAQKKELTDLLNRGLMGLI